MATFKIPVVVEYCSELTVTADSWDEALSMVGDNPTDSYREAARKHDLTTNEVYVDIDWDILEDFNKGVEDGKAEEDL